RLSDRLLLLIPSQSDSIDAHSAVNALAKMLETENKVTRLETFEWLAAIHKAKSLSRFQNDLLGKLLSPLSDPSDEVVAQDLRLLA
ncbi:hypothetical protein OYG14_13050, partial [Actinobacillus pleuropneumoniae]|nr:hypothetical protein [Actinobacillus pleuropneumoniae]